MKSGSSVGVRSTRVHQNPFLVIGAGGHFGRYVAPELMKRGAQVRGLVHHAAGESVARDAFSGIHRFYSRYGFPGGHNLVLRTILGREPRTMAAYIAELAAESVKSRQISG